MHLSLQVVRRAVDQLSEIHPFFGITFLVCKEGKLPVGSAEHFPINSAEETFLKRYYRPDPSSRFYFQPFTSGTDRWLAPKYPYAGSQSTRTRGHLAGAFIHRRGSDLWGWRPDYIRVLQEKIEQDKTGLVPAFWLAAWLYRHRNWAANTTANDIVTTFVTDFSITEKERTALFQTADPSFPGQLLTNEPFQDSQLLRDFDPAPDANPQVGTLRDLQLRNVGPTPRLDFAPAERVSIITGDNGLGKTFLLECCWRTLTGDWAGNQALPLSAKEPASISFVISRRDDFPARTVLKFDKKKLLWVSSAGRPTIPGLVVYVRVDGSFAVWDPARHIEGKRADERPQPLVFSRDAVLDGIPRKIGGLILDWVSWQNAKDQSLFAVFRNVLERLSPPDMTPLSPGEPTRIPHDSREIPTLNHEYGTVPFTNESAGIRRIASIAYLLVWAWKEHRVYSEFTAAEPQRNMIVMIDELEAHLHPKWQRVILPALLEGARVLSDEIKPQLIVATHSPLILASMESTFSEDVDKLFHLHLAPQSRQDRPEVALDEEQYVKHGTVDAWLTSETFELKQARSQEGETALEAAKKLFATSSNDTSAIATAHRALRDVLPAEDPFWPRWLHFVEMKGVRV